MNTCDRCGGSLKGKRAGARFCSKSCRNMFSRAQRSLPAEMREVDRWVGWKPVRRNGRETKVPIQPNGRNASSTDPATWCGFDRVKSGRKGFVLGDGFGCVDFDHVIVDGVLDPVVAAWLDQCSATLVEVSPSGDGLHVWGKLPEARGHMFERDGVSVEIYSVGRYVTVTGERWAKSPSRLADLSGFVGLLMS